MTRLYTDAQGIYFNDDNKFRASRVQWSGEQKSQGRPGPSDSDCCGASGFGSNLMEEAVLYFEGRANFGRWRRGATGGQDRRRANTGEQVKELMSGARRR